MQKGWVRLYRSLEEWEFYFSEPFTKGQAWIDLFMIANHSKIPKSLFVRGNLVEIKRGQVGWSEEALSKRWKWSRNKVRRYLEILKMKQQIEQQKNKVLSVITILNYERYQSDETTESTTERQQKVQQTDTNKNVKNGKNVRTTTGVVKKLEKWLSNMEDVSSSKGLAFTYLKKYPERVIERALNNSSCVGRAKFIELCEFYLGKQTS